MRACAVQAGDANAQEVSVGNRLGVCWPDRGSNGSRVRNSVLSGEFRATKRSALHKEEALADSIRSASAVGIMF
jgi:hypothetical protein